MLIIIIMQFYVFGNIVVNVWNNLLCKILQDIFWLCFLYFYAFLFIQGIGIGKVILALCLCVFSFWIKLTTCVLIRRIQTRSMSRQREKSKYFAPPRWDQTHNHYVYVVRMPHDGFNVFLLHTASRTQHYKQREPAHLVLRHSVPYRLLNSRVIV